MEPALDVIGRALQGDSGACSFLDRTSSIYVLDATDPSKPKTYGCWNFIHQAMNEVERYEANFARSNQIHALQNGAGLNSHVKLLATMALRVARRSPDVDRSLVSTCVVNAGAQFNGTPEQSQWLIDLNLELREIVMGRIAAMAFDFSFHRRDGPHGHSAFADSTVMEIFCAVLASNAVSSGPLAVRHFVTEWIVPSAKTLPPFAIACVTLHLALGALRKAAPAGTKDVLQQLSASIVAAVLSPVLLDAVAEDSSAAGNEAMSRHEKNNQIAAICIRALERWCAATDLSLAQIKHICSKVEVNFIEVINDAMYSDSKEVVDALAELIEACVSDDEDADDSPIVLEERMTQVRYLLQVDEVSFQSNFSADQLNLIESKEMSAIVDDLVSAIGLQRFRFTERQNNGDHDVCRSLVRIASALCSAAMKFSADHGHPLKNEPGLIDLMMKGAAHPSVNISGITLGVLADVVRLDMPLGLQLLPLLQRRAITPHHVISGEPYLAASDICGVNFHEFQIFRDTVLTDALVACYEGNSINYMDSCTSAVEEFCSENASSQVSLHLEAALFCLAAVAELALGAEGAVSPHPSQLERCTSALAAKPNSMMTNPLTLAQMCRFLRKYTRWYGESQVQGVLDVATDLALSTFNLCAASYPGGEASRLMMQESSISPGKEAALTLQEILCHHPKYFVSNSAITALGAGWEASYGACNRTDAITIEDRQTLCVAICHVLAALPENQRVRSFHALALPALDCLEKMTSIANNSIAADKRQDEIDSVLSRVADEIQIFTTMARTFTNACFANDSSMESGCSTAALRRVAIPAPLLAIIRKSWPSIVHVAAMYSNNEKVAQALGKFLVEFLPPECKNKPSFALLKELCSIALSILKKKGTGSQVKFQPVVAFLTEFVSVHGEAAEAGAVEAMKGQSVPEGKNEVSVVLTELLVATVDEFQTAGSESLAQAKEQGQGQPPFESKSLPQPKGNNFPGDEFCGMLSLFKTCLQRCPLYFFHLPSAPGLEGQEDLLSRKASDAAVAALNESDVDTATHAMDYLDTMLKLANSPNESVSKVVQETTLRLQASIISMLLLGSCGRLSHTSLGGAAQLIQSVITAMPPTEELRSSAINTLKDEQFRLGEDARQVVLNALEGVVRNEVSLEGLRRLLEQMWELHQLDEVENLEASDVVLRFVKQFRR